MFVVYVLPCRELFESEHVDDQPLETVVGVARVVAQDVFDAISESEQANTFFVRYFYDR